MEQHGFVPRRSTATNLAVYHSFVSRALDDGLQVATVYTDFQKAFDTVDHSILLSKLSSWGFCGPLLSWINSYLSGREQIVRVSNSLSSPINVTSGVPQGSHLGPLLFNVFINDLVDVFVGNNFLLYADDLKVFRRIHSQSDAIIMQDDLDRFALWCSMNNLRLHTSKCVVLRAARGECNVVFPYKIGDDTPNEVSEVIDLGISIMSCFDFRNQYMRCTSKALRMLGFISRFARHFRNIDAIKLLYAALVRPHVEYASVIWNPRHGKYISSIERVQHKFLRFAARILGMPMDRTDHNYGPLMDLLNIPSLVDRRHVADMMFLYNLLNGHIDCPVLTSLVSFNAPQRHLRSRPLFSPRSAQYRHYSVDPFNRAMSVANQHFNDCDPFILPSSAFRSSLYRLL